MHPDDRPRAFHSVLLRPNEKELSHRFGGEPPKHRQLSHKIKCGFRNGQRPAPCLVLRCWLQRLVRCPLLAHRAKVNVNGTLIRVTLPGRARHRKYVFAAASSRSLELELSITVTRVTLPVSGLKTSSHLPAPVICFLRASS